MDWQASAIYNPITMLASPKKEDASDPELIVLPKPKSAHHINALDGIRGLAVLMVFAVHYGDLSRSDSSILVWLNSVKSAGWIGVDLFFALSGFPISVSPGNVGEVSVDEKCSPYAVVEREQAQSTARIKVSGAIGLVSGVPHDSRYQET